MAKAKCPVCGLEVEIPEDYMPGELVEHSCGVVLEVVKNGDGTLAVRVFGGVQEDWGE